AEVLVLEAAETVRPGRGGEEKLQRPAVAHAFRQVAVAVHVGVDETGMKQLAPSVDFPGTRRSLNFSNFGDRVATDENVGGAVAEAPAADHNVGHFSSLPAAPIDRSARPERIMYQNRNTPGRAMKVVIR